MRCKRIGIFGRGQGSLFSDQGRFYGRVCIDVSLIYL